MVVGWYVHYSRLGCLLLIAVVAEMVPVSKNIGTTQDDVDKDSGGTIITQLQILLSTAVQRYPSRIDQRLEDKTSSSLSTSQAF